MSSRTTSGNAASKRRQPPNLAKRAKQATPPAGPIDIGADTGAAAGADAAGGPPEPVAQGPTTGTKSMPRGPDQPAASASRGRTL